MLQESPEQFSVIFNKADLGRIEAETFIDQLEYHRELSSTNDLALELVGQEGVQLPLLVLAESQTAGRGRRSNQWWSAKGALTFSLLLDSSALQLPASRWPQVSLTAGLALCEALEEFLPQFELRLKWPNDVYGEQRKISGILVEVPRLKPGKLVLGIGINVNNSLSEAPEELAGKVTSLCDAAGKQFPLTDVLILVLDKLAQRLKWIGTHDEELRTRWRKRCMLTNRRVRIDDSSGLCQGIDEDGALVLQTEKGLQRYFAGTVTPIDNG